MLQQIIPAIISEFEKKVKEITSKLYEYLLKGNLAQFEEDLHQEVTNLYNQLALAFIMEAASSKEMEEKARIMAQKKGLGEIRQEKVEIQLRTGYKGQIFSWYAVRSKSKRRKKKRGPNGSGCHLVLMYWGCILKASPAYYSFVLSSRFPTSFSPSFLLFSLATALW